MARSRRQDRRQAWVVNTQVQRFKSASVLSGSMDPDRVIIVNEVGDLEDEMRSRFWGIQQGLTCLHLFTCESGRSICLDGERVDAVNALAYLHELTRLSEKVDFRGAIVLHLPDGSNGQVDPDLLHAIQNCTGVTVYADAVSCEHSLQAKHGDPSGKKPSIPLRAPSWEAYTSVFDLKRSATNPGPKLAKRGDVVQHFVDFAPSFFVSDPGQHSISFELELSTQESFLGGEPGAFWRPVLINRETPDADAFELSVIWGDSAETVGLRDALGLNLAIVTGEAQSDGIPRLHGRIDRSSLMTGDQKPAEGAWRMIFYGRMERGSMVMKPPTARSRMSLVEPADADIPLGHDTQRFQRSSESLELASSVSARSSDRRANEWGNTLRVDRPHRSQASRPANYREVLRARHVNWQRYRTAAADHE